MAKKCKHCGGQTPPPHLNKFCSPGCHNAGGGKTLKRTPLKQPTEIKINHKSKTNKNVPAEFSQKTKKEILARDKVCIISGKVITDYHHVFYGANANRGSNRNDADQGVGLNSEIHRIIHHPSPSETGLSKIYRAKCIIYVKSLPSTKPKG